MLTAAFLNFFFFFFILISGNLYYYSCDCLKVKKKKKFFQAITRILSVAAGGEAGGRPCTLGWVLHSSRLRQRGIGACWMPIWLIRPSLAVELVSGPIVKVDVRRQNESISHELGLFSEIMVEMYMPKMGVNRANRLKEESAVGKKRYDKATRHQNSIRRVRIPLKSGKSGSGRRQIRIRTAASKL